MKTIYCNSVIEVDDGVMKDIDDDFDEGQIMNLVLPVHKIHRISSDPNDATVRDNYSNEGYMSLRTKIKRKNSMFKTHTD